MPPTSSAKHHMMMYRQSVIMSDPEKMQNSNRRLRWNQYVLYDMCLPGENCVAHACLFHFIPLDLFIDDRSIFKAVDDPYIWN